MGRLFKKTDAPKRTLWDRVKHVALLDESSEAAAIALFCAVRAALTAC